MAKSSKQVIYEFEEFRLDAAKLMLYRDGQEVSLPPKVIETLLALVENQGEIIAKDELMNRIWADSIVEESNLSQCLYLLRKRLGTTKDGKPFIETLRRRGYRFNGDARLSVNYQQKNSAADSDAPPRDVERNGNVLKLIDWDKTARITETDNGSEEKAEVQENAGIDGARERKLNGKTAMAAAAAAFAAILVSLSFAWLMSAPTEKLPTERRGEMTITRLTNGAAPQSATISPDGKFFVYHEQDGETARLWLQQVGAANRIEIAPPTHREIIGATVSPDGDFVYFVARDKGEIRNALYRVSAAGEAETKILVDINSPPSFSPDGSEMIFDRYDRQTGASALVIAASGGEAERILLARARGQELTLYPAWSPDGLRIAFCAIPPNGSGIISAVNPQTGEIAALSPEKWDTCYRSVWTRDGAGLVFVGTKYGDGLSTRRDQIYYLSAATGEARRLTFDGSRHGIFSLGATEGDAIIAVPFNRSSQIWAMSSDGDSRAAIQITNGQADGRAGLTPLADGRVGYVTRTGENLSFWLMDGDGGNQKQLISDKTYIEELRAAPDASFFVFSAPKDSFGRLFRVDAEGENLRQLTFGVSHASDSTVSPDGNWIVYNDSVWKGSQWISALWKIPANGGEPLRLGDVSCHTPHFAPDGETLSCIRDEKKILVVSATDGAVLKIFETVKIPALNVGARWTADGQNLVYIVHQKNVGNLWLQPIAAAAARPLTNFTGGSIYNFAFSPDGERLYVARGNQINDAVLIENYK